MDIKRQLSIAAAAGCFVLLAANLAPARNTPPLPVRPAVAQPENSARIVYAAQRAELADSEGKMRPVKSLLRVPGKLDYGESLWNEDGVPDGKIWIRVDRKLQTLSVFRAGHEIGTAIILFGADSKPTPAGSFNILQKIRHHRSRTYNNAPMPYTMRLTSDGVAIHGSDVRFGAATHGCVGLPADFAAKLFAEASVGDEVSVV